MEALFNLNKDAENDSKEKAQKSQSKQAENIWSMLDEMAINNPESYRKFIDKTINEGKEAMKPPEPHMCVKTRLTSPKPGPLFVNVFSWKKVAAPKSEEDSIPVYGSKLEYDKVNAVVNLIFNPEVLEKYGKDAANKSEQEMLINLAYMYTEDQNEEIKVDKNKIEILQNSLYYGNLDYQISKLTNKKYKSTMSDLEIAKEALGPDSGIPDNILNKLSGLNDISISKSEPPTENKNLIEEIGPLRSPSYEEKFTESKNSAFCKIFELRVDLPKINSMNECELDIDTDYLTLNFKNKCYQELKIPIIKLKEEYKFTAENIEAKFIKKTSVLRVKITLANKESNQ